MGSITQKIVTTIDTPSVGYYKFAPKADGFYAVDENGVETKIGGQGIFGSNFQETENTTQMELSTLTPTTFLSMTTASLPLGKYRIGYNFSWSYDDVAGNAGHIAMYDNGVRHNTTDITMETKNIFDIAHIGTFIYLDNASDVHTLELKIHCDDIADTITMQNAYIECWRVE